MKPDFALNLSHDGISLLQRAQGGWVLLDELSLDADDLVENLAALRERAEALAPQGLMTKLVIPASQILYTRVEATGPTPAAQRKQIATALKGMTPYPPEDLVFDWVEAGSEVLVAVVARETLAEAESFAQTYGFSPVAFCATPEPDQFTTEAWFGLTSSAAALLPEGARIERDTEIIRVLSANEIAELVPTTEAETPQADIPQVEAPERAPSDPKPKAEPQPAPPPDLPRKAGPPETAKQSVSEPEQASEDTPPETIATPETAEFANASKTVQSATDKSAADKSGKAPLAESVVEGNVPDAPLSTPEGLTPDAAKQAKLEEAMKAVLAEIESHEIISAPQVTPEPPPPLGGVSREDISRPGIASDASPKKTTILTIPGKPEFSADKLIDASKVRLAKAHQAARQFGKSAAAATNSALQSAAERLKETRAHRGEAAETASSENTALTVFGAPKKIIGSDPKHLGIALVGGLVTLMLLIGLWTSFLGQPTPEPAPEPEPEQIAAATPAVPVTSSEPAALQEAPSTTTPQAQETVAAAEQPSQPSTLPELAPNELPPPTVADVEPVFEVAPLEPTPEGIVSPDGFTLFAGQPDVVPGPRPATVLAAYAASNAPYADPELEGFYPRPRPASVIRAYEESLQEEPPATDTEAPEAAPDAPAADEHTALPSANPALANAHPKARPAAVLAAAKQAATPPPLASPADARLASVKPVARPASILNAAKDAQAAAAIDAAAAALANRPDPFEGATRLAVTVSRRPTSKPSNISAIAASARRAVAATAVKPSAPEPTVISAPSRDEELDEPEPVAAAPKIPTSASVAKRATVKNGINLGEMNLIGLFGSAKSRRALIRMPNGKFIKVGVGDRLDGGKVTSIGANSLNYTKRSRNYTLKLLKGS